MLNITAQRSSDGAKTYFAKSDYYAEGQEVVGRWGGQGAVLLGLFGDVDKAGFNRLCDNLDPQTGRQLTAISRDGRRVGYDFTWSAPKSVSAVHALTGDGRVMRAFRDSVRETMEEMEADMQARVRKGGAEADRATGNMLWAEFVHLTSRPVGGVPCPQLHAHCFAFNATYDAVEDQWKAGQFGRIKGDGYYWQAVQQARFADGLQRLGYPVRATKDAFEIDGLPQSLLKKFSLRTAVIDRVAEALGITERKRKAALAATTREAKDDSLPYPALVEEWRKWLTPAEAGALDGVAAGRGTGLAVIDNATHARFAAEHAFERSSVQDERRLLTLAMRHGVGRVTPEGVRAEMERMGLLKRVEGDRVWVTTRDVLAEEGWLIGFAAEGKGTCRPLARPDDIDWRDDRLTAEQRRAVSHVLTSPDRVMLLRGVAGTGKTTLTREAVAQVESRGRRVVMLAPSAQASRGVLRDEGFAGADTLARFLLDEKMQARARDGVIWLDEAGLVGSKTMASLFRLAGELNARVVLAGDKKQLASVERGSPLRVLEDLAGLPVAEVTDIRRQAGDYREAVQLLSRGEAAEGLAKLDAMGWVKLMPEADPYGPIAEEYVRAIGRGESALIVCPTHAEGAMVTAQVRARLKERGSIRGEERDFGRLVPLHWTEAERADGSRYTGAEVLQFHRNAGPFKAGEQTSAAAVLPHLTKGLAASFTAYRGDRIGLGRGDTVRVTANGKTKDGRHRLNNGAVYDVRDFTAGGDIELSNGWVVARDFGHLAHGYVSTDYAAQGRTVDRVLIAQSGLSYPAASREGFYVAASRGRKSVTIYTDDKAELRSAAERSRPRPSATELLRQPKPQFWRRAKAAMTRLQSAALLAATSAERAASPQRLTELAHAR